MMGLSHCKHSVLVVDDQEDFRKSQTRFLSQEGVEVWEAESGSQALALVAERLPCLALVDMVMPGMDGLTLCRRLRQDSRTAHLPLMLVTGEDLTPDLEQCAEFRVSDFIRKPLDLDEMRFRIRTQIRLHEAVLEREEARQTLETITCAAKDAILMTDGEGNVCYWNAAATSMFGYALQEIMGRNAKALLQPELSPEESAKLDAFRLGRSRGDPVDMQTEVVFRRMSGERFPAEVSLATVRIGGGQYAVGIARDISERKQVEERLRVQEAARRRMEVELRHSQKLEAVGQLAAGIAHEINTPTQFVGDSLSFIQEAFDGLGRLLPKYRATLATLAGQPEHAALASEIAAMENEVDLEYLQANLPDSFQRCLDGVRRITNIVRAMKEFAHPGPKEKRPADLNHAITNALVIASNEYKYVADVETNLGEIPAVLCQLDDVNQVLLNLIVNAAHAIADVVADSGKKGKIRVSTKVDGDFVGVEIADTGGGIPEEIRERIFEPFFTTKPVGKGTGQGLSIARSIVVDKHCGTLTFQSVVGAGTTFTIRLPIDGHAAAQREAS